MALCFLQVLREPVVQYLAGSEQRIAPFWNIITWYPTGAVIAGDYIVASGNNDGIGIAIAPDQMTPEDFKMAVGQAWESSAETGVKLVNTAVGLAADDAYAYMKKQDQRIASLEKQLNAKMARLDRLAGQLEALTQKVAYIQLASMAASAR